MRPKLNWIDETLIFSLTITFVFLTPRFTSAEMRSEISTDSGSVVLRIQVPEVFTNRVEIYSIDLAQTNGAETGSWSWGVATINLSLSGSTSTVWEDTGQLGRGAPNRARGRVYAFGNASVDVDGDGLANARELLVTGTDLNQADSDGDGFSDGFEVESGYDPMSSLSVPLLPSIAAKNRQQFFFNPGDIGPVFHFILPSGTNVDDIKDAQENIHYVITDIYSNHVSDGDAMVITQQEIQTQPLSGLGHGYYEIRFEAFDQVFGLLGGADLSALPVDPYFSADTGYGWYATVDDLTMDPPVPKVVPTTELREDLLAIMSRLGIAMGRERFSWFSIIDEEEDFQVEELYETLYGQYGNAGREALIYTKHVPKPVGRLDPDYIPYPNDLVQGLASYMKIAKRYGDPAAMGLHVKGVAAHEVWNEPFLDERYSKRFLPAEQYLSWVKTLSFGFHRDSIGDTLVGGSHAGRTARSFLTMCYENGLLDIVDAVSAHWHTSNSNFDNNSFSSLDAIEYVQMHRDYFRNYGRPSVPLWITESGGQWREEPGGTGRPNARGDMLAAMEITAKAVEFLAAGVDRYFAFFLLPSERGAGQSWSMMDDSLSPMRSLAGYAHAINKLRNKVYIGDLAVASPALLVDPVPEDVGARIHRARVFMDTNSVEGTIVFYTAKVRSYDSTNGWGNELLYDIPELAHVDLHAVSGLDGRNLLGDVQETNGTVYVPISDSLTFITVSNVAQLVNTTNTMAWELLHQAQSSPHASTAHGPIVLQHLVDLSDSNGVQIIKDPSGYWIHHEAATNYRFRVRVSNLSDGPHDLNLGLILPDQTHHEVSWDGFSSESSQDHTFASMNLIPTSNRWQQMNAYEFRVWEPSSSIDYPMERMVVNMHVELSSLEAYLDGFDRVQRVAYENSSNFVGGSIPTNVVMLNNANPDGGENPLTTMHYKLHGEHSSFSHPMYLVEPNSDEDLRAYDGIALRARSNSTTSMPMHVYIILKERKFKDGIFQWEEWWGSGAILPADGCYHQNLILFDEFRVLIPGPQETHELDRNLVRHLSIAVSDMEPMAHDLYITDVYLVSSNTNSAARLNLDSGTQ